MRKRLAITSLTLLALVGSTLCSAPAARPRGRRRPKNKSASVRGRPIQRGCHATAPSPKSIAALPTVPAEQDGALLVLRGVRRPRHHSWLLLGRLDDRRHCPGDGGRLAAQARQELAAVMCVDRFMAAPDVGVQLTALQEITSSYAQSKFVEEGGWAMIVPASSTAGRKASADDRKAAGLCAAELAKREIPTTGKAALINDEAAVVQ